MQTLSVYWALGPFELLIVALFRHLHVLTGWHVSILRSFLLSLFPSACDLPWRKFAGLFSLCDHGSPSLLLEWIDISNHLLLSLLHLILKFLQASLFFSLLALFNLFVQILHIIVFGLCCRRWFFFRGTLGLLTWTLLSLILRLHFLLILLDHIEKVLRHEQLVAELIQKIN